MASSYCESRTIGVPQLRSLLNLTVEFDRAKCERNLATRGLSFDVAGRIWDHDVVTIDVTRPEDGESRYKAIGTVEGRPIAVIWTPRGTRRRILSARKASRKERNVL